MNTHCHADHVTGTGVLRKKYKTPIQTLIAGASGAKADVHVKHGDMVKFGDEALEVRSTPGHTDGCITYVHQAAGLVFTGDALLIGGCGRTDFQQGNAGENEV